MLTEMETHQAGWCDIGLCKNVLLNSKEWLICNKNTAELSWQSLIEMETYQVRCCDIGLCKNATSSSKGDWLTTNNWHHLTMCSLRCKSAKLAAMSPVVLHSKQGPIADKLLDLFHGHWFGAHGKQFVFVGITFFLARHQPDNHCSHWHWWVVAKTPTVLQRPTSTELARNQSLIEGSTLLAFSWLMHQCWGWGVLHACGICECVQRQHTLCCWSWHGFLDWIQINCNSLSGTQIALCC